MICLVLMRGRKVLRRVPPKWRILLTKSIAWWFVVKCALVLASIRWMLVTLESIVDSDLNLVLVQWVTRCVSEAPL